MTTQALLPLQGLAGLLPGTRAEPEGDGVLFVPVERPAYRWADLQQVPDDGNRYEIIDGGLLVTPPPDTEHADIAEVLRDVLRAAAPRGVAVYTSALGVDLGTSVPIPDLVAFHRRPGRRHAVDPADILLVAEVVSPGRERVDHERKRRAYAAAGIAHYWIVDLTRPGTALRLGAGTTSKPAERAARSCSPSPIRSRLSSARLIFSGKEVVTDGSSSPPRVPCRTARGIVS